MRHVLLLLVPTLAAGLIAAACSESTGSTDNAQMGNGDGGVSTTPTGTTEPSNAEPPLANAGAGGRTGLPCDVQAVIEGRCIACHAQASPPPLLNYDDLAKPSTRDPAKTRAQMSVELLKTKVMPPVPAAPPDEDEIKSFEDWVAAGTPKNAEACTEGATMTDGGAPGPKDGGASDAATAAGCTSGKLYVPPDPNKPTGAPIMEPGNACLDCHQRMGGPNLRIAGTVYPTLKEPNRCIGSAPPPQLRVTVTDSSRPFPQQIRMNVNEAGNFFTTDRFRAPIVRAVVEVVGDPTKTRVMNNRITQGDCNSCHTPEGRNNAPGRIMAPQ